MNDCITTMGGGHICIPPGKLSYYRRAADGRCYVGTDGREFEIMDTATNGVAIAHLLGDVPLVDGLVREE